MFTITAFTLAARFIGVREVAGAASNPTILSMLHIVDPLVSDDAVPWCGAFVEAIAWLLDLPRPRSLRARAWLHVGSAVALEDARIGFDVIVLKRGPDPQPGPEHTGAPGHVGFFAGFHGLDHVLVLGGNQGDRVSVVSFPRAKVLGVRRLLL